MTRQIRETELKPHDPDVLGTIFAVGNGRHTTRGTLSEDRHTVYRGVFMAGLYTRAPYGLMYPMGAPDWLTAWLSRDGTPLASRESERTLDLQEGILSRFAAFEAGKTTVEFREERFASFADPSLAAQRIEIRSRGDAALELSIGLDGEVRQSRAKYFRPGQFPNCDETGLRVSRVETVEADSDRLRVVLLSEPTGRRAAASAVVRQVSGDPCPATPGVEDGRALLRFSIPAGHDGTFVFEKLCILTGDLDDIESAAADGTARARTLDALTYDDARTAHADAVSRFWSIADVEISGDERIQTAVRFAVWTTRIAAPNDGGAASIGAKNLTGDWYRGGVFWDMDIYQLPMLVATAPELARNHVLYRCNRLDAARTLARQDGYRGARFVGTSYDTGLENPIALGGLGRMEIHVSFEVTWGIQHYYALTGDAELMLDKGLELVLEVTKFWASKVTTDEDGSVHLRGICGPDELHKPVDDNAYKNRMIAELFVQSERLIEELRSADAPRVDAMLERIDVDAAERAEWKRLAEHMYIPMVDDLCFDQFDGHHRFPEPNRGLVKREGMGADKVGKQADTLLLFQNLPWAFSREQTLANYRNFAPLCNQTSSLSCCSHALVAARLGFLRDARYYFDLALGVDLEDSMGNSAHGIHGAGEGGIWLAAVHGFGGLTVAPDHVAVEPKLPPWLDGLRYRFSHRGVPIEVDVRPNAFTLRNLGDEARDIRQGADTITLAPGGEQECSLVGSWEEQGLEGVVLDLDGVLVRTDGFHYQAWKALADRLGIPFDEEKNHQLRGVSREESLKRIYGDRPLPPSGEFQEQCDWKNARYVELIQQMGPDDILPGSVELLTALRDAGIKCAIASASKNTPTVLERTGLDRYVDAVIDGTCVTRSKPDPQGFFLASQRLRVLPWNCIGIEDAESGIEAIHRAGMLAVAIGEQAVGAELTIDSVDALSVNLLQDLFGSREPAVNPYLERNIEIVKAEAKAKV